MTDFAANIHRRGAGVAPRPRARSAEVRERDQWRLMLIILVFALCYGAVAFRMGALALSEPEEPSFGGARAIDPVRGEIVDRDGALLAANLPAWSLYTHPEELNDPIATARELAAIFPDTPEEEFIRILTSRNGFEWVRRPLTPREKAAVQDLGRPGLFFGARDMRVYPSAEATAHLVGGVRAEVEGVRFAEFIGSGGVESHFDERLRDPGRVGDPLALSIDLGAQQALREVLASEMARLDAKGASGVLMDARTGEIVSLVSLPDFDPNSRERLRRDEGGLSPRFNRAVQGVYELGSVLKVVTAAVALDLGVATPDALVETGTPVQIGRNRIRDFHRMPDAMTVTDIVVRSSNIGTVRLVQRVGTERFREYLGKLGLFEPSPVELGEARNARPLLPPRWSDLATATISFGHGLSISPLHLASAYATLANDGRRVRPTLLKGGAAPGEQVFSPRTSRQMMQILRETVARGTGRRTNIEGYEVGGKTGTADKPRENGRGYHKDKVIATFASVFPTSDPKYVLVVSLDEPVDRSGKYPVREASRTAVPAAAAAIRRIAPLLGLRPAGTGLDAELSPVASAGTE